ncbi:MAG TPA: tail fiber domain-containing protein, partial [candidate division Zixibacteria bacterium]|nr:tail fiber domain-containing protein [candidate division Zixibacteria bacterium]
RVILMTAVLFCLLLTASEAATVPMVVTHQGRLLDATDKPVDGFFDIEYRIFTDSSGGTELWTETHTNVEVKDGLFTAELGKSNGFFDICCYDDMWLEIHVVGDPTPISPRTKLGGSPFSAMSHSVGSSHAIGGSLDTAKIDIQANDAGASLRLRVVPTAQTTGRGVSARATQQGGEIAIGDPDFDLLRMTGDATGANVSITGDPDFDLLRLSADADSAKIRISGQSSGDPDFDLLRISGGGGGGGSSGSEIAMGGDPDFDLLRMSAGSDTAKIRISGQSSGDPDFDLLRIVAGKGIGDGDVYMTMSGDPDFDLLRLSANADSAEIKMSAQDIGDPDFDLLRMMGKPKYGDITIKVKNSIGNIRGITTEVDSTTASFHQWTWASGSVKKDMIKLSSDDETGTMSISNGEGTRGQLTGCAPGQSHIRMFQNDDTTVSITSSDTETSLSISNAAASKGLVSACAAGQTNISATRDGQSRVMVSVDDTSSSIAIDEEGVQITMRADTGTTNPSASVSISNAAGTKGIVTTMAGGSSSIAVNEEGTHNITMSVDSSGPASIAVNEEGEAETAGKIEISHDSTRASVAVNEEGIQIAINADSGGSGSFAINEPGVGNKVSLDSDGDGYLSNSLKIGTTAGTNHIEVVGGANCDGTNWNNASDVNSKENFQTVDGGEILERLEDLDITRWNYKGKEDAEHIGPTAQDFYKAFGVGNDDKTISTVDPSGIALAAIKELYKKSKEVDELKKQLDELAKQVEKLAKEKK